MEKFELGLIIVIGSLVGGIIYSVYSEEKPQTQIIKDYPEPLTKESWMKRVDTQCNDPWDSSISRFIQNYTLINSEFEPRNNTHLLDFLRSYAIPKFYEQKEIKIFDIKLEINAEKPDLCEGCSCNAGGHAWHILVSNKDVDKLTGWDKD